MFSAHRIAFDNEVFFAHRMKSTFIGNLWSWENLYSVDSIYSLFYFLTWLGRK